MSHRAFVFDEAGYRSSLSSSLLAALEDGAPEALVAFVRTRFPDEDGDSGAAPKKGKKSSKKGGSKTLIYVGAGVGVLAVVLLVGGLIRQGADKAGNDAKKALEQNPLG